MEKIFEGVFRKGKHIYTYDGKKFRMWNPYRSKMAGAILKGLKDMPVRKNTKILYLGVATGTTAEHLSDIAREGIIYGVEISFKAMKKFLELCKNRNNLVPILADANKPEKYRAIIEDVDLIYQDISQKNQVDIFLKNMETFNAKNGIIMVKARSIDVSMKPEKIFEMVKKEIEKKYKLQQIIDLNPYAKDHIAIFVEML